jgi:hypothetical protein
MKIPAAIARMPMISGGIDSPDTIAPNPVKISQMLKSNMPIFLVNRMTTSFLRLMA